uniref:Uncharacterized protein n=1 Tax=Arundo donax TaxID=35708 RepID=A0A0A9G703_ARUDO
MEAREPLEQNQEKQNLELHDQNTKEDQIQRGSKNKIH